MFAVRIVGAYLTEDMGEEITAWCEDEGRVSIGFPWDAGYDDEEYNEDEQGPRPPLRSPERWCNAAGVSVDGEEVNLWISTGDPRGAFQITARRLDDGTILLHLPYPEGGTLHEEVIELHPGTLAIKRTLPKGAGA